MGLALLTESQIIFFPDLVETFFQYKQYINHISEFNIVQYSKRVFIILSEFHAMYAPTCDV